MTCTCNSICACLYITINATPYHVNKNVCYDKPLNFSSYSCSDIYSTYSSGYTLKYLPIIYFNSLFFILDFVKRPKLTFLLYFNYLSSSSCVRLNC